MKYSLDDVLRALNVPAAESPPECVCGEPVQYYRQSCPKCQSAQKAADRRLLLGESIRSLAGFPWAVWGKDWANLSQPIIVATMSRWTRAKGNVLLSGPSGCGKTSASVARARMILQKAEKGGTPEEFRFACGIRFASALDLSTARKQHALGHGEPPEIETALDAELLILDELGFESQADTVIPELADLRYRKGKITITTTGLRSGELVARYGEATIRKLSNNNIVEGAFEKDKE